MDASWVKIEEALSLNLAFNHTARLKEIWLEESSRFREIERGS